MNPFQIKTIRLNFGKPSSESFPRRRRSLTKWSTDFRCCRFCTHRASNPLLYIPSHISIDLTLV
ncbi:unnamed protein product [Arabidopsis halleri]